MATRRAPQSTYHESAGAADNNVVSLRASRKRAEATLDLLYIGTLPPHPGGSAVSAGQLLAGLARLGHRIRAIAPLPPDIPGPSHPFGAEHPQMRVTRVPVPYFETAAYPPVPEEYRRLEGEQIRRVAADLIAQRRPHLLLAGRESFAGHAVDLSVAHGLPCAVRIAGGTTLALAAGVLPPKQSEGLLERLRRADLLVTPARHLANILRGLGCGNLTTIPNAIDTKQFAPRPSDPARRRRFGIGPGGIVALHASNLKAWKRPHDIVDAAHRLRQENSDVVFVVVGDGPLRVEMEMRCRGLRLTDCFRFTGWVPYTGMPAYMAAADLVLMPSEGEGLARVYLEAMASGRVLVASDIPAAREVIDDGRTGLLFPKGDIESFARAILRGAGDPSLRVAIGLQARRRALKNDIAKAIPAYETALQRLVRTAATLPARGRGRGATGR